MGPGITAEQASRHAWLDVQKGRIWKGVRVPVELALRDGALVLRLTTTRIGKKERSALVRFCGDEVLSTLIARREEPEIPLPLATTRFGYPSFPGLGRTTIRIFAPDRPNAVLSFVDPDATGDPMANPYGFTMRLFRAGPAARQLRDRWKAEIESAAGRDAGAPVA